jgi:hypothetical protein
MSNSDYHLRNFPYAGLSFPSESPFFPVVYNGSGGSKKARFNQGYVFDYQSLENSGIRKIKVEMDDEYPAEGDFHVDIITESDSAKVKSAELKNSSPEEELNFHYNAQNLGGLSVYTEGVGTFKVPACSFGENGIIENIYLRENIHWQKINFANEPSGSGDYKQENSIGVLYNWGEGTQFNDNETVKFARIEQKPTGGSFPNGKEKVIKIERSTFNEANIVVTTQFPEIDDDETSILVRKKENEWEWLSPFKDYTQLLLYRGDTGNNMQFFDVEENTMVYFKDRKPKLLQSPISGTATPENPYHLIHDGDLPSWVEDNSGIGGSYHPWKVTPQNSGELASWDVVGGTVYTQGTPFPVADDNIVGEYGYIVLKIEREFDSREITTAVLSLETTIPDSTYAYQYRPIASVNSSAVNPVTQYQFEEMRIYEELVLENGEFKLQGYEVSHRNNYYPPI